MTNCDELERLTWGVFRDIFIRDEALLEDWQFLFLFCPNDEARTPDAVRKTMALYAEYSAQWRENHPPQLSVFAPESGLFRKESP